VDVDLKSWNSAIQCIGNIFLDVISRHVKESGNNMGVGEKETRGLVFFPYLATRSNCGLGFTANSLALSCQTRYGVDFSTQRSRPRKAPSTSQDVLVGSS
jgi:hypothetical protein